MKAIGVRAEIGLYRLDVLVDFRNAIGHGNETEIAEIVERGEIKATKRFYRRYRGTVERLASTIDEVVATKMADLLGIPKPW